jgi:hypothetical protein
MSTTNERNNALRRDGRKSQKTFNSKPKDVFHVKPINQLWPAPARRTK